MVLQMSRGKNMWVSAHIFYAADLNTLLKNLIFTTVNKLKAEDRLTRYFFIRYHEQGIHIRLRLLIDKEHEINIKQSLTEQSIAFFQSYPSIRKHTSRETDRELYPNDTVQFIDYYPEIERYGNPDTIPSAELQFESSSEAVLKYISAEDEEWNISKVLIAALKIHVVFFRAMDLTVYRMINVCHLFIDQWLPALYNSEHPPIKEKQAFFTLFEEKFLLHRSMLIPAIQRLLNEAESGKLTDFILINFYNANKQVKMEYDKQSFSESRLNEIFCSFLHILTNVLDYCYKSNSYKSKVVRFEFQFSNVFFDFINNLCLSFLVEE